MNAPIVIEHAQHAQRLVVHPTAGCVAVSWVVSGRECLTLPDALPAFLASTRTGGIPLLYPYANRLSTDRFEAAGRSVDLTRVPDLKRDGNGLPIHGLLLRWSRWELEQPSPSELRARIRWGEHPELIAAFPFPHSLLVSWRLGAQDMNAVLDVEVQVHADGGCDVPIAFGWHPYFAASAFEAAAISADGDANRMPCIDLPTARRWALDPAGVPSGGSAADFSPPHSERVGAGQDALLELSQQSAGAVAAVRCAGSTTELHLRSGWRFLQVYSPHGVAFAAIEPMTAATNALVTGAPIARAGSIFSAAFTLKHRCIGARLR